MAGRGRVAMLRAMSCVVLPFVFTAFAAAEGDDHVLSLTAETFDDVVQRSGRVLVEFYAPWCGACKALEPEYQRAAAEMKEENLSTVLAKVDATVEKELAEKHGVSEYPTLKYFVQGEEPREYGGNFTASGIKAWLRKRELPAASILTEEQAATYIADAERFAKHGGAMPDGTQKGSFRLVAKVVNKSARAKAFLSALQDHLVDWEVVSLASQMVYLPKSTDPKGPATSLVLWREGFEDPDAKMVEYTGKWVESAIAKWVKSSVYPLVGNVFSHKLYSGTAPGFGNDGAVVVVLDDGAEDGEDEDKLRPSVMKELVPLAASEPRWLFTAVSLDTLTPSEHEILGISSRSLSTAVVLQGTSKYHLQEKGDSKVASPGAVRELLASVKSKNAKAYYKSAAVPDPEVDEDGVTTLVGDTFDKHVMDPQKDVFVEFYAPWCGHCQKLAPAWTKLAQVSKAKGWSTKGVVIAKMDATENECQETITGYPKLVLYPAVKADKKLKQKVDYSGARDFEPLVEFLLESAKTLEGIDSSGGKTKKRYSMVDKELEQQRKRGVGKNQEL